MKYARKETAKFTLGLENINENPSTAAPQGVDTMLLIISGVCDTLEIMKKHVEQKLSAMRTHRKWENSYWGALYPVYSTLY